MSWTTIMIAKAAILAICLLGATAVAGMFVVKGVMLLVQAVT